MRSSLQHRCEQGRWGDTRAIQAHAAWHALEVCVVVVVVVVAVSVTRSMHSPADAAFGSMWPFSSLVQL